MPRRYGADLSLTREAQAQTLIRRHIAQVSVRIDGYADRREMLLSAISKGMKAVKWSEATPNSHLLTAFLRETRELEKQAAIELGQWTEKRDVKMDAQVGIKVAVLSATFTLEELEAMMGVAFKAAEQQQQQPVSAAAISSAEHDGISVTAEVVETERPKDDEPAEPDTKPPIPEWMK